MIKENSAGYAWNADAEISVLEYDIGRFAAKFQRDFFQVMGCSIHDQFAHFGGARERDFINLRVGGESASSSFPVAGYDVDHAIRKASFTNQFSETNGRKRCLLSGLEHDGATSSECRA